MSDHLIRFQRLVHAFTTAVETNDGLRLGQLFTSDGVYADGFYGDFRGPAAIANMLREHFWGHAEDFSWRMDDLAIHGAHGYATYLFSYRSKLDSALGERIAFEGIAHFEFEQDRIKRYEEVFNTGVALAQLNFPAERIMKHLQRKANQVQARLNNETT